MTKTLVVPLDGSQLAERALDLALPLARRLDAEIRLVTTRWNGDIAPAARYLEATAALCDSAVVSTYVAPDEQPAIAVGTAVLESPEPAVVMATHGRGAMGAAVLGSVATDVVRCVRAPVVLVGPDAVVHPLETVVVPLDGSARSESVLPTAEEWARALGVPVHLLAVPQPTGVEGLYTVDDEFVVTERRMEHACVSLRDRGVDASYVVRPAVLPARAIVRFARELPGSLLCMSTHGRTGLARVALGGVTMAVVRHASCPVLCVRPRDLVE